MFIAHGDWLRKHSRWILAGVLLVLLPGFIFLFSTTGGTSGKKDKVPTLKGKPVNAAEFQRVREATAVQLLMSTGRAPRRTPEVEAQITQEAMLRLLLLRKAQELGISVSDGQVIDYVQRLQLFANPQGRFDPQRYQQHLAALAEKGISEPLFEELMRDQLTISQVHDLVTSAAQVTPEEVRLYFAPLSEKVVVNYVAFRVADFTNTVTVTDDEAKKFFDDNKEAFREPEKLKVRYALLPFAEAKQAVKIGDDELAEYYELNKYRFKDDKGEPKPLETIKEELRTELLAVRADRKAGDQATELSVKLVHEPGGQRPDLAKLAPTFGGTLHDTGYFTVGDDLPDVKAGRAFGLAAFSLSAEVPFSDPVRGDDAYYVLELLDRQPTAIPAWETVRNKVSDRVRLTRAYDALVKRGTELASQIRSAMTAGTNFTAACRAQQLDVQTTKPFSVGAEPPDIPSASRVAQMSVGMATNAVSAFTPSADGGLFFHVAERTPADPKDLEKQQPEFAQQLLQRKREALFRDWLNALWAQSQVDLHLPPRPAPVPAEAEEPAPVPPAKS
jgi:peptidyl-prolyl cis-trans isomerase D